MMEVFIYNHKLKRKKDINFHQHILARYCGFCGCELLGLWEFPSPEIKSGTSNKKIFSFFKGEPKYDENSLMNYDSLLQYNKEFNAFLEMDICPVCGTKLINSKVKYHLGRKDMPRGDFGYFSNASAKLNEAHIYEISNCSGFNIKSCIDFFNDNHSSGKLGCETDISSKCINKNTDSFFTRTQSEFWKENYWKKYSSVKDKNFENSIADNYDSLCEYLFKIIKLESSVYSLSKRVLDLCYSPANKEEKNKEKFLKQRSEEVSKAWAELYNSKSEYQQSLNYNPEEEITIKDIRITIPKKPIPPVEPKKPVLRQPGFFNKRKVLAENNQLMSQYNFEFAEYEKRMKAYNIALNDYKIRIDKLEEERQQKYLSKCKELKENNLLKCKELKKKCDEAEITLQKVLNGDTISNNQFNDLNRYILAENEIKRWKELIDKTCSALAELYSYGVIPVKYRRDMVAISSFYEYLISKRCDTLYGPSGACNLYENEKRMNLIISKLSDIVTCLEEIKDGQHILYSEISESNKLLNTLNRQMGKAVSSLNKIEINTDEIKSDTKDSKKKINELAQTAEVIAYNTAINAYYSKKNAELTDALGYMVALN